MILTKKIEKIALGKKDAKFALFIFVNGSIVKGGTFNLTSE